MTDFRYSPETFSYSPNEWTRRVLAVMVWCLQAYFQHTHESAIATVRKYYLSHSDIHDDDLYQHEGAYWMALRVHFVEDLRGDPGDFHAWRVRERYIHHAPSKVPSIFDNELFEERAAGGE